MNALEDIYRRIEILVQDQTAEMMKQIMSSMMIRIEGPDALRPYGMIVIESDAAIRRIPLEKVVASLDQEVRGRFLSAFPPLPTPTDILDGQGRVSIDDLKLSTRPYNTLRNMSVDYVDELVRLTEPQLLDEINFGKISLNEIKEALAARGLCLASTPVPVKPIPVNGHAEA